jgi:hypothetical protein
VSLKEDVAAFLTGHPEATPAEVAAEFAISIGEARKLVITTHSAPPAPLAAVEDEPVKTKRTRKAPAPAAEVEPDPVPTIEVVEETDEPVAIGYPLTAAQADAEWLAGLFQSGYVYDIEGAAKYLGIARNSVEYAVVRGKLSCVLIPGKKLFARADLDSYIGARDKGRKSRLTPVRVIDLTE